MVWPAGQVSVQTPSSQRSFTPHATPQPPQCWEDEPTSTQAPSQSAWLPGQLAMQAPSEQISPAAQVTPQAPQ